LSLVVKDLQHFVFVLINLTLNAEFCALSIVAGFNVEPVALLIFSTADTVGYFISGLRKTSITHFISY